MAKTRTQIDVPIDEAWFTVLCHNGELGFWEPSAYHTIFAYQIYDIPPTVGRSHSHNTAAEAFLEALTWAALPEIGADCCIWCRLGAPGPTVPRWNIYRGPDKKIVPATFYWDWYDGPPPGAPI